MNEPKPFASLSSGLLARKGSAKPAMRPQSYRFNNESNGLAVASPSLDDLGWNDMGDDVTPETASAPVALHGAPVARLVIPPRVVAQQEELAHRLETRPQDHGAAQGFSQIPASEVEQEKMVATVDSHDQPVAHTAPSNGSIDGTAAVRPSAGAKPKAAFTLRLDPDRHLRLRLICAVTHRSAQQVVTQALDEFLARQPENSRLASLG